MKNTFKIGQRVRVSEISESQASGGGKTHYGRIENIVRDMFDGSDLYLVNILGEIKTYKAESFQPLRRDLHNNKKQSKNKVNF